MFETGELVMLGASGVCEVLGTTHMDMPGVDKDRLYYVMKPKYSSGSKVYTPVDSKSRESSATRRPSVNTTARNG